MQDAYVLSEANYQSVKLQNNPAADPQKVNGTMKE